MACDLNGELAAGQLWCFSGELGAGKTELIRQMVTASNPDEKVTSPSYNLENRYSLDELTICHWDLYRLGKLTNLPDLDEQIGDNKTVLFVEWPERYPELISLANFNIQINVVAGGNIREIAIATKPK